jgi:hypothetical protein
MVSVTGLLATLDPGNQEKGNPEALAKTSLNAEVAEERRFGKCRTPFSGRQNRTCFCGNDGLKRPSYE